MKFLISYTNPANAWEQNYRAIGSTIEFKDLEELTDFIDKHEGLASISLHVNGLDNSVVRDVFCNRFNDEGDLKEGCNLTPEEFTRYYYTVTKLPSSWKTLPWIEINNGYDD